jgi:P-type Ca2+ transporter type 2C
VAPAPRSESAPAASPLTEPAGLGAAVAAARLAAEGPNELPGGERRRWAWIVVDTARQPMFLLLLAAGALYVAIGDWREGLTLFGFVLVSLGLTLFQEGRTERAIRALRDLTSPRALVVRDGVPWRIAGREVVRGDLLKLAEGDRVPADALLLAAEAVRVDESLLTGESVAVGKRAATPAERAAADRDAAAASGAPGGDDRPWVSAGTLLVQGQALARVTATGGRSAIGRIGAALGTLAPGPTPLQRQTARLVRQLAWLSLGLGAALVLAHGLLKGDWLQALLAGIALAMALLPEEYPVVMTVFPALGARRLSRHGVLTRRITALEALGATTVLCADKTGTLTENRMTVSHLVAGGVAVNARLEVPAGDGGRLPEDFHTLVEVAILASVVDPFDPMEQAFHRLGWRFLADTEHLHHDWRLVRTYALTPELRAMSHVWAHDDEAAQTVAAKGAPEAVIDLCHLGRADRDRIAAVADELAAQGLRVLAVARGRFAARDWPDTEHGFDFEFVGLLGLADPLRAEVPAAVAECHAAGLRVLMITGDYPATALAVARQAGLAGPGAGVLSGDEIARLDDDALRVRLAGTSVCARIAPEQKLRIVQALQAGGEVVAMTGDGVNDAPALRAADVGVAMGGRGTDVARESASLVLVNDDFASIVRAVRLGRRIFDNLRKAMSYILAVHVPIAGMALLPLLFGWPTMLYPMHIALLQLIIDPACSIVFENEPDEGDVMRRPPRDAEAPLFGGATLAVALLQGAGVLVAVVLAHAWAHGRVPEAEARAFAFATLVAGNLALIVSSRAGGGSLVAALRRPNAMLWGVTAGAAALVAGALYAPWAAGLLRFTPLPAGALLAALGLGVASVAGVHAIVRRRPGVRA